MTTKQMSQFIGKKGTVRLGGLVIEVEILDVKVSYSRTRYLVSPLAGAGEVWVESIANVNLNPITTH